MASKKLGHTARKTTTKQQRPKEKNPRKKTLQSDTDLVTAAERAKQDEKLLTPHNMLTLQRVLGNQALNQIVANEKHDHLPQKHLENSPSTSTLKSNIPSISDNNLDSAPSLQKMNNGQGANPNPFPPIPGWNAGAIHHVAQAFAANANGLTPANWVTIAGYMGNNQHANTIAFAQLAGWNFASIDPLAQAFAANANALTATNWTTIAGHLGNNQHANTIAFTQLAGWNFASIDPLAQAFAANANALTIANWITIAGHLGNNQHANTIAFAQLAGWNFASIDPLAQAFAANANGLTAANWITIAGHLGNDQHANTISFCQLAGWNFASIDPLAQAFAANPHSLTAATWIRIAGLMGNNQHAETITHAQNIEPRTMPIMARPEKMVGRLPLQGNNGMVWRVNTSQGSAIHVWVASGHTPANLSHFCHGHALNTYDQFGYTPTSGATMQTILNDEYQALGPLHIVPAANVQTGNIIVWRNGGVILHSARITHVVANNHGGVDPNQTLVTSKNGAGPILNGVSIDQINQVYNNCHDIRIYQ